MVPAITLDQYFNSRDVQAIKSIHSNKGTQVKKILVGAQSTDALKKITPWLAAPVCGEVYCSTDFVVNTILSTIRDVTFNMGACLNTI